MIRRFLKFRPALITGFVLLWAFHFSFGMFHHYHPDYVHAHDGEMAAHAHGGHFHSLALERLASLIEPGESPLLPGETHHHSESAPGGDPETTQYNFNQSSLPKINLAVNFNLDAAPVSFVPVATQNFHTLLHSSDTSRILLFSLSHSERSPPLRV